MLRLSWDPSKQHVCVINRMFRMHFGPFALENRCSPLSFRTLRTINHLCFEHVWILWPLRSRVRQSHCHSFSFTHYQIVVRMLTTSLASTNPTQGFYLLWISFTVFSCARWGSHEEDIIVIRMHWSYYAAPACNSLLTAAKALTSPVGKLCDVRCLLLGFPLVSSRARHFRPFSCRARQHDFLVQCSHSHDDDLSTEY